MLNKKGIAVDDTFPLLVIIVLFVIVIAAVFISGTSKEKNTQEKVITVEDNLKFIEKINHLMNKEIKFEYEQGKMIDFIATLGEDEKEKTDFLKMVIEGWFGENELWGLEISGVGSELWAGDPVNTGLCLPYNVYTIELPHSKLTFVWC